MSARRIAAAGRTAASRTVVVLAGVTLAAVTLGVPALGAVAPRFADAAQGSLGSGARSDAALCGADAGGTTYNGTNPSRDLQKAIPDPLKVANYPCPFPADVRGIRIDSGSISLVSGGKLVRTIPLAATTGTVGLAQIVAAVGDPSWISMPSPGVVVLSAALVQQKGTHLRVAAPAVKTLRLVANPGVSIGGSGATATFQGVDVMSWDASTNAPVQKPVEGRPFILYENASTLSMKDSSFTYLGSDQTSSYGVSWRVGGTNGTVDNCVFAHNFFGAYTYQASNVVFENSTFDDNTFYGIDPHTNSTHITVENNDVYGNGDHGIVFSRYVTDSIVRGNSVHDNAVNGIMMDYHSDNNVIDGNTVSGNAQGIVFSGSADNDVWGNKVTGNVVGIRASHAGADADNIHDNIVTGGKIGVQLYGGATTAKLTDNTVENASKYGIVVDAPRSVLSGNKVSGAATGVKIQTVASLSGGSYAASDTAISVAGEGYATVNGVKVASGTPVNAASTGFLSLAGTAFGLPTRGSAISWLDVAGVLIVAFALLCEIVYLVKRMRLRRISAELAVAGVSAFVGNQPRGMSRLALRPAVRPGGPEPATPAAPAVPPTVGEPKRAATDSGLRRFRPDIEGLRAIAILSVMLSHAALGLPGGYVGVDVFFVISGFLITRQLVDESERRGRFSFAGFYARRIRRILPAATLVTVVTLAASYHWVSPLRLASIARDGLATALFCVNWRFAAQATDYFNASAPQSPFQQYWSLSVEEQFYVVWPLLIAAVLLLVRKKAWRGRVLLGVLVVIIAASLWASVHVTAVSAPYGYFGTHTRVWELALGAALAVTAGTLKRLPRSLAAPLGWLGLCAIVTSCFVYNANTLYPGIAAVLPVAGAGILIAAGCGAAPRLGPEPILAWWPMKWTGRISYSLYLWHWPLLILLPDALGHSLDVRQRLLAIAAAFVLSVLTYVFVEQPFRERRSLVRRPRRAFAVAAGLIGTAVACSLVMSSVIRIPGQDQPATTPILAAALQGPSAAGSGNAAGAGGVAGQDAALTAALTKAAQVTQLPANVQPALSKASTDFPDTQGCEVNFAAKAPQLPCNQFGDPHGAKQVVLVGDSHAGMWLSGLNAAAQQNHWKLTVFTKSGCSVGNYPDLVNPTLKRTYTECNAWRTAMLKDVAALHPAMVVIGSEARDVAAKEPSGMEQSVTSLEKTGAKVVFLGDTPSPRAVGSVPDCLSSHPSDVKQCDVARSDARLDSADRRAEMQAAREAGATVVDPAPWFCTATVCPVVVDNIIVYEDESHITATYGTMLAPELSRALTAVLS